MPLIPDVSYRTKSAVLFVIFNRPETTAKVFEQIKIAQPARLYIVADGPRADVEGDSENCKQTRAITAHIDWECDVKRLERTENLGCREGVSAAIDWFFSFEEEGIILEDDCLPASSFFRFCDTMLDKYRNDTRVRHITGCNLQQGKKWGAASYYFSNRTHVWGWASWRRVWKDYDKNLTRFKSEEVREHMLNVYPDAMMADHWTSIFNRVKAGEINSWAYPLDFVNFFNNGLTVIPNQNLISNIGFGQGATQTVNSNNTSANVPLKEIGEISAPLFMIPEKRADYFTMLNDFNITRRTRNKYFIKQKTNWFKSLLSFR
jgi:hypothetical protein